MYKTESECLRTVKGYSSIEAWYNENPDAAHAALILGCMSRCVEKIQKGKADIDVLAQKDELLRAAMRITPKMIMKERSLLEKKNELIKEALEINSADVLDDNERLEKSLSILRKNTPNQSNAPFVEEIVAEKILKESEIENREIIDILMEPSPVITSVDPKDLEAMISAPIGRSKVKDKVSKAKPTPHKVSAADEVHKKSGTADNKVSTLTKEECIESASTYLSTEAWFLGEKEAYLQAKANGWLDFCVNNIGTNKHKVSGVCVGSPKPSESKPSAEPKQSSNPSKWVKTKKTTSAKPVKRAKRSQALKALIGGEAPVDTEVLTEQELDSCLESVVKYDSIDKWKSAEPDLYNLAASSHLLEICEKVLLDHLQSEVEEVEVQETEVQETEVQEVDGVVDEDQQSEEQKVKWVKAACLEEAGYYPSVDIWLKASSPSFYVAVESDFYEECVAHMTKKWNKEACMASAAKYKTIKEWQDDCPAAYSASFRNKCHSYCTAHMKVARRAKKK